MFTNPSLSALMAIFAVLIFLSFGEACAQEEQKIIMDAVLVIDNSGSMDWIGHDQEKNRFEGARIFIDKSETDDAIALIDFSGNSELILPLTKVSIPRKSTMKSLVSTVRSDRKLTDIDSALRLALQELSSSRADPAHTPVVVFLTDGEIDVVEGTEVQKRLAAKRSENALLSRTISKYTQSYIPVYTVALGSEADTSVLEKISKQTKLKDQANEQHHFSVSSGTELVEAFSSIISQIKKRSRATNKYHFTGEPIHQTTNATPFTKRMAVDVLLGHKKNMQVTLKGPDGQLVKPHSQGDKYNLYEVDNPTQGEWNVSVEGEGENDVIIATVIDADIEISLPFASRFKIGEDIPIFANVMYKNKVVEGSVVQVDVDGQKHPFTIKEMLLTIHKPDGKIDGPFPLENEGGSYNYFYKDADLVGNYTLDFDLEANFMDRDTTILAQKKIYLFHGTEPPTIHFKTLKDKYSIGDAVPIELSVTKNAQLMSRRSIPVEVSSPQGTKLISVPRQGSKVYSFSFTQTDQKGEYRFIVPKTEEYKVIGSQQSIEVITPFAFPWKLVVQASCLLAALILLAIIGILIKRRMNKRANVEQTAAETIANVEQDKDLSEDQPQTATEPENYPIPNEILIWDKHVLAGYIDMTERQQSGKGFSYYMEYLGEPSIKTSISKTGLLISRGDIVNIDKLKFHFDLAKDGSRCAVIDHPTDLKIKTSDQNNLIQWFVLLAESHSLKEDDIISPNFLRVNTAHIGQDAPNELILSHPSVSKKHAVIRKDVSTADYFMEALDGKLILNDAVVQKNNNQLLHDGDIVKIGVFTFQVVLDENELQLKVKAFD